MRHPCCVIFDLDGVLLDSEPLHVEATNQVLQRFGKHLTVQENAQFMGLADPEYWAALLRYFGLEGVAIEPLLREKARVYSNLVKTRPLKPFPGIPELLEALRHAGCRLAVASSSRLEDIETVLRRLGLRDFFDAVVSGEEVPRSKPDPAIFLEAARRLECNPENCVAIEDSLNGLRAARAAGMRAVAFNPPVVPPAGIPVFRNAAELQAYLLKTLKV